MKELSPRYPRADPPRTARISASTFAWLLSGETVLGTPRAGPNLDNDLTVAVSAADIGRLTLGLEWWTLVAIRRRLFFLRALQVAAAAGARDFNDHEQSGTSRRVMVPAVCTNDNLSSKTGNWADHEIPCCSRVDRPGSR